MKTLQLLIITLSSITTIGIISFVLIDTQSKSNENDTYALSGDYVIANNITTIYNKSFFVSQSYPQDYVSNAIQFHGVIFSMPNDTGFANPGGFVSNLIKFTDNTNETLTTGYGGHPPNTITVLTRHVNPQAGVTRYSNGSINFLVNTPMSFSLPNPTLTDNEKQQLIDIALNQPGVKAWSDQWNVSTINFKGGKTNTGVNWQEAIVFLRMSPSTPAPYQCKTGWIAEVGIDMTTHEVMDSLYPTIQSHECTS